MGIEIVAALIALAGALGVSAISAISGLRLWESQKLNAVQPLTEKRIERYTGLWKLTDFGTKDHPADRTIEERRHVVVQLRHWYYAQGGGLLLSEDARRQWSAAVCRLEQPKAKPSAVRTSMTCLRTRLKQDVHVHDPDIDDTECRGEVGWRDRRNIWARGMAALAIRAARSERGDEAEREPSCKDNPDRTVPPPAGA